MLTCSWEDDRANIWEIQWIQCYWRVTLHQYFLYWSYYLVVKLHRTPYDNFLFYCYHLQLIYFSPGNICTICKPLVHAYWTHQKTLCNIFTALEQPRLIINTKHSASSLTLYYKVLHKTLWNCMPRIQNSLSNQLSNLNHYYTLTWKDQKLIKSQMYRLSLPELILVCCRVFVNF